MPGEITNESPEDTKSAATTALKDDVPNELSNKLSKDLKNEVRKKFKDDAPPETKSVSPKAIKIKAPKEIETRSENDRGDVTQLPPGIIAPPAEPQDLHAVAEVKKAQCGSQALPGKASKDASRKTALATPDMVGQGLPAIILTPIDLASPPPLTAVSLPPEVRLPLPASGSAGTAGMPAKEIGAAKAADSRRSASASPWAGQNSEPRHTASAAPRQTMSLSDIAAANIATRSETLSEPVAAAGSVVMSVMPPMAGPSPILQSDGNPRVSLSADRVAPADQIVPALVNIMKSTDGTPSVTVRLQPPELGEVQIRIDQTSGGTAHIKITTEQPETLRLLQHDEPRLQQALDLAGVLSTGRTVSFQVIAPEQAAATVSRPDNATAGSSDFGQGQSGGPWRQNEDAQRNSGQGPASDQGQARTRWFRAGLDITA